LVQVAHSEGAVSPRVGVVAEEHIIEVEKRGAAFWMMCNRSECGERVEEGWYLVGRFLTQRRAQEQALRHLEANNPDSSPGDIYEWEDPNKSG
jgi:hypothetical protein